MIYAIRANMPSFRTVEFKPGFNIILADRTETSNKKDSRNGLGKSTLIEIIHFCFGSGIQKNKLLIEPLRGWIFYLDIAFTSNMVTISRRVDEPSRIYVEGDTSNWPIQPEAASLFDPPYFNLKDWTSVLGALMFGLPVKQERIYHPTFRSLISYLVRQGRGAYNSPFLHHFRVQQEWDEQINITFLLELDWEDASDWQLLKDRQKALKNLKKADKSGLVSEFLGTGTLGELEATKVRLQEKADRQEKELKTFRIHPQYKELDDRLNLITEQIHDANNKNFADQQLVDLYQRSIQEENEPQADELINLYQEAGVALPGLVQKRLEEAQVFHAQIIKNRRQFLVSEIERLSRAISTRTQANNSRDAERASLLEILQTHNALEEYNRFQRLYLDTVASIKDVDTKINRLREFEEGTSRLRIEQEVLQQRMRRNLLDRTTQRERAIGLFNSNSESLYNVPGTLAIDISGTTGFQFKVEIKRDGSDGIDNMKIFCFDLMIAQLWSSRIISPKMLVHDSIIFDGVDERQRALALELAVQEAQRRGFQYICTYNTDDLPYSEFSAGFNLESYVRLILTDATVEGSLLGIRF